MRSRSVLITLALHMATTKTAPVAVEPEHYTVNVRSEPTLDIYLGGKTLHGKGEKRRAKKNGTRWT